MPEQRDQIVKRVVHALEEATDPEALVRAYFDEDREVVIEATRQTLEATRDDVTPERLEAAVDRELIEALRFPVARKKRPGVALYLNRGKVAAGSAVVTASALIAWLMWFL